MIHFTTALNIKHTFIQLYSTWIDEMAIIYCSIQVLVVWYSCSKTDMNCVVFAAPYLT